MALRVDPQAWLVDWGLAGPPPRVQAPLSPHSQTPDGGGHLPDTFVEAEKFMVGQPLALEDSDDPVVDAVVRERSVVQRPLRLLLALPGLPSSFPLPAAPPRTEQVLSLRRPWMQKLAIPMGPSLDLKILHLQPWITRHLPITSLGRPVYPMHTLSLPMFLNPPGPGQKLGATL